MSEADAERHDAAGSANEQNADSGAGQDGAPPPESWLARRFPNLARHWLILRESWRDQNGRDAAFKPRSDHEFLPAALEIIEKPPSPGLRWLMIALCSLFAIALGWSILGKVDVVVTGTGKVVPSSNSRIIQPIEIGAIRTIHVRNGQHVRKGQLLVELDPTISTADESQSAQQLLSAEIISARNAALLAHLRGERARFVAPADTPEDIVELQEQYIRTAIAEYEAEKASLEQQRAESSAERDAALAEVAKLEATLPLLDEQLEARRELTRKGYFARLRLLEFEQLRVEHIQDIEVQKANAARASAAIANVSAQLLRLRESFGRTAVAERAEAEDRSALAREDLRKSSRRREFQQIRSPVNGTVQQLTLTTIGGVVQPAEPIMVIVPDEAEVEVEARILNRDIGFVHVGQPVRVKLEAYNFTDYGLLEGEVANISRDAIADEQLGLVYAARIRLKQRHLVIDGRAQPIGPGLAVQAEIKTGERRIIQYILSPIAKTLDEAGRER